MEIPAELARWLAKWRLRVDERASHQHAESRNPTLICRARSGARVFVKASVRGDEGVELERQALTSLRGVEGAPIPAVLHEARGVLALEWIEGSTLFALRRRRGRGHEVDAEVGAALARIQVGGATTALRERLVVGDLGERIVWTTPELYSSLGPAALTLFGRVQTSRAALATLTWLLETETAERALLVHGDLRQPNVLVSSAAPRARRARRPFRSARSSPAPSTAPPSAQSPSGAQSPAHRATPPHPRAESRGVIFLDWEMCGLGDPARDLGMLIADDYACWLAPASRTERQQLPELHRHARVFLEAWEEEARALDAPVPDELRARVVAWMAEALLRRLYTVAHHQATLDEHVLDAAVTLLEDPRRWAVELLGDRS